MKLRSGFFFCSPAKCCILEGEKSINPNSFQVAKGFYIHIPQGYEKPLKITKNAGNGATIEDQFKFDRQSKTTFTYLHILGNLFAKLICNGEQKLKSANIGRPPCSFRYVMIMSEPFSTVQFQFN